eukprot:1147177-Pelagomonas_calceolata.AAC.2
MECNWEPAAVKHVCTHTYTCMPTHSGWASICTTGVCWQGRLCTKGQCEYQGNNYIQDMHTYQGYADEPALACQLLRGCTR